MGGRFGGSGRVFLLCFARQICVGLPSTRRSGMFALVSAEVGALGRGVLG